MARASAPWFALAGLYVAAALLLEAGDPAVEVPVLLDRIDGDAVRVASAVTMAAACGFGAALARVWVPEPWATRGVLLAAVSPLAMAASTQVRPGAFAALLITAALVLALRVHEQPRRRDGMGAAICLALLPWLGAEYAAAGLPILLALVHWTFRRGRPLLGLLEVEVVAASAVALIGVQDLGGDLSTSEPATALQLPALLLVAVTVFLLVRSRIERLSRAFPARRDAEIAAIVATTVLVVIAVVAIAGDLAPEMGVPIAGALAGWGLRRFPWAAIVVLALTAGAYAL